MHSKKGGASSVLKNNKPRLKCQGEIEYSFKKSYKSMLYNMGKAMIEEYKKDDTESEENTEAN